MRRMLLTVGLALFLFSPAYADPVWFCEFKQKNGNYSTTSIATFTENKIEMLDDDNTISTYLCDGNVCAKTIRIGARLHHLVITLSYTKNADGLAEPDYYETFAFKSDLNGLEYVRKVPNPVFFEECVVFE